MVTTVPAIMLIDHVGRKPLLLAGSAGMFLAQLITGIIVAKCQSDWPAHVADGWAAVAMIWFYIFNFAYSWGPGSWVMIAEIFPLSIRAKGTSVGASSNWMNNFIIAFITPPMLANITFGTYLFFSAWCFLGGLFVFFFLPETKGKTLEEMDHVFGYVADLGALCGLYSGALSLNLLVLFFRADQGLIKIGPLRVKRTLSSWLPSKQR